MSGIKFNGIKFWNKFLLKFNVPFVSVFEFENCTFPQTVNIQNILQSMDIQFQEVIIFTKLHSTLSRQNLQNLSVAELQLSDGNFTEIPYDLLYDLQNLEKLKISNTHLERIPVDFFANWSVNIREVHLAKNRMRKITRNDFAHVINVKTVYLAGNVIDDIEPGAFDNLLNLRRIKLRGNQLHTLSPNIFNQLGTLKYIDLGHNSFDDHLPQDLLKTTKNLESFFMSKNQGKLNTLPGGFFENLVNLENVVLVHNRLISIPLNLFVGCSKLIHIDLSYNQLKILPSGLFNDTRNLKSLHLAANRLKSLPAGIFKRFDRLDILDISDNQFTTLTSEVLDGLQSVLYFDASTNNLSRIDYQFIFYLKSARRINLSNNQLTFENSDGIKMFEYQNAILSTNSMSGSFAYTFGNQTSQQWTLDPNIELKITLLNDNKISNINAEVMNILKYSKIVDLTNKCISKINISDLTSGLSARIKEHIIITLTRNPLHCDCDIIDFVRYENYENERRSFAIIEDPNNAQYRYGYFCASPPEFKGRVIREIRPEELSCPVKVSDLDDACSGTCTCREYPAKQVLSVDCSYRNSTRLPSTIEIKQNWSIELNMTGNILQIVPSVSGSYLKNVTSLDLSNNKINKVTIALFSPSLEHLKLHSNQISRLDSNVIEYLMNNSTLTSFTLHDNKWICDCKTRQFLNFVKNAFARYDFHEVMCYGANKKLHKMSVGELCEDTIAIIIIASLLIASFGLVATLVGLYYRYQWQIKMWLYSRQLCLWLVREDELDKDKEYNAFISFSHKDEDFVEKEIIAKLEEGPRPYKLCLHYRDWLAGEWIPAQISHSVAESRRTIVVLTPNFLESVWGLMEFRAAHTQALKEGRARLIVIVCGEIGNVKDLDQELIDYLRLNTYIKWGDPWFRDKLKYALPHTKVPLKTKSQTSESHLVQISSINQRKYNSKIHYPYYKDSIKLLRPTT